MSKFTTDKILNATLLQMKLTDGVQVVCVLQLSNEIAAVFWHKNKLQNIIQPKHKMVKIKL